MQSLMEQEELRVQDMDAQEVRERIRNNEYAGPTSGLAPEYAQANLVILPHDYAFDFLKFCVRNPKPCPVLEVTDTGSPEPGITAPGADLRTDVPKYRVYEDGEFVEEPQDILHRWRDDLVAFLLGCSFTFEVALLNAGLRIAHIDQERNVPMYTTNRDCVPSGPFAGPLVVSMRPYRAEELPLVVSVTGRYPSMHGAPVHVGDPEALGIEDLDNPEFGEPVTIEEDQMPVFWACGVTPQAVVMKARPPLMITHCPGHMFITDRRHSEYEV
ncbi:MAG TPA: putative hydro-lyase [Rubrobacteraceae bacterium]|nr:putative hydro-lyase [Rubrobacteraceae bacterium]